ncbi:MAG TPA: hypothetical protein VMV71_04190 [Candidatus Paceibacterota bacterium]|nr:hypothetical protein [Candidatus Paceibacterota bacterium]
MTTSTLARLLPDICQQIFSAKTKSMAAQFWAAVQALWFQYWLWILIGLAAWILFEILTRNKGIHYDSENGFSPAFNIVVGSGVYILFQAITYFVLRLIFGDGVYCSPLPYIIHTAIFGLTWLFLRLIGFWVY